MTVIHFTGQLHQLQACISGMQCDNVSFDVMSPALEVPALEVAEATAPAGQLPASLPGQSPSRAFGAPSKAPPAGKIYKGRPVISAAGFGEPCGGGGGGGAPAASHFAESPYSSKNSAKEYSSPSASSTRSSSCCCGCICCCCCCRNCIYCCCMYCCCCIYCCCCSGWNCWYWCCCCCICCCCWMRSGPPAR